MKRVVYVHLSDTRVVYVHPSDTRVYMPTMLGYPGVYAHHARLPGWYMHPDHGTRVVYAPRPWYPGGYSPPSYPDGYSPPCYPGGYTLRTMGGGYLRTMGGVYPEDHGRYTPPWVCTTPYYGGYTPPWVCTTLPPPGYTHHPATLPSVRAASPAHAEVPVENSLGSNPKKHLGERPLFPLRTSKV